MRGIDIFLTQLADFGVRLIFGNPGTTELPLMDALVDHPRLRYVLGLHEGAVLGMADGYAQASGQLAVVNLHVSCGVGNAMGQLYNAYRENTPLLVTAGQQDRRLLFEEPLLWGDLVNVVRPWTKMAVEIQRLADLPRALQRAVQAALTPPTGPVFVSLPMDLQMELSALTAVPKLQRLDERRSAEPTLIREAAARLLRAKHPAILAGSRVVQRQGVAELVRVAEQLGADVYNEPLSHHGRLAFPCDHPLACHSLPLWSPEIRAALRDVDVLFVAGMDLLRQYLYHDDIGVLPADVSLIHLDEDARELNKNYVADISVWADTRTALAQLAEAIEAQQSAADRQAAAARTARRSEANLAQRDALIRELEKTSAQRPMPASAVMQTIARSLPREVAVIETAVTSTQSLLQRLGAVPTTDGYFGQRGWTLGWGLNAAIGVRLAWPDRPVLAILGDGAALYGIQGLWTAAHYRLPVIWLICNNREYRILKQGAVSLGLPHAQQQRFESLAIEAPAIDYVQLARSLGVEALRLDNPADLGDVLSQSWQRAAPLLIDVPIA